MKNIARHIKRLADKAERLDQAVKDALAAKDWDAADEKQGELHEIGWQLKESGHLIERRAANYRTRIGAGA